MTTPPSIPEPAEVNREFCFTSGGWCVWRPLPVPSTVAWRECRGCGRVQYQSRRGWSETPHPRSALHWHVMRTLWHRNRAEWEIKVHSVGGIFEPDMLAQLQRIHAPDG